MQPHDWVEVISVGFTILLVLVGFAVLWGKINQRVITQGNIIEALDRKYSKHMNELDVMTPDACGRLRASCPEVTKMANVEKSVEVLCRTIAEQSKEHNRFVKEISMFMGKVEQHMQDTSETFSYLRSKKFVTALDKINGHV